MAADFWVFSSAASEILDYKVLQSKGADDSSAGLRCPTHKNVSKQLKVVSFQIQIPLSLSLSHSLTHSLSLSLTHSLSLSLSLLPIQPRYITSALLASDRI